MENFEDILADEADTFSGRFSGSLRFDDAEKNGMTRDASVQSLGPAFDASGRSFKQGFANISFEVISADPVEERGKKFVVYSVLLVDPAHLDTCPVTIRRRFSEFSKLNDTLKKRFPEVMRDISFPRKLLTASSNFKPENIAQRSRAFEQYLSHLYSIDTIRLSKEFVHFFYQLDLQTGYDYIHNGQYSEAIPLLQRSANIEKKILGCDSKHVIATLCALVCAYHALDKNKEAQNVAEAALRCIGKDEHNKHLVALLQLSIRLCWTLGKDKKDLEARLQELRDNAHKVVGGPTLLELVVSRFQNR